MSSLRSKALIRVLKKSIIVIFSVLRTVWNKKDATGLALRTFGLISDD